MLCSVLRNRPALIEKLLCNYFPFSVILMKYLSVRDVLFDLTPRVLPFSSQCTSLVNIGYCTIDTGEIMYSLVQKNLKTELSLEFHQTSQIMYSLNQKNLKTELSLELSLNITRYH